MSVRIKTETAVGLFIIAAIAIFFYMSYHVGSFRFDRLNYNTYTVYFQDVSGLNRKADVKIAGVKVGWVDELALVNDGLQVKATIMVDSKSIVHADAYAVVRQEGFLGTKHLELIPGSPQAQKLESGSMLTRPTKNPVTFDEMLQQFSAIADSMQSVVQSINKTIGGPEGERSVKELVDNLQDSLKHFASFTTRMDRVLADNESSIGGIFHNLNDAIPRISANIEDNVDRVSRVLERDFNRMATGLEQGIAPIRDAMNKINEGQGILGQLITDEEAADDLRTAINGVRGYFDKLDQLRVIFDIHTETMSGPIEDRLMIRDSKAYVNARLCTTEDYFYQVGLVSTRNGKVERYDEIRDWYNDSCDQLIPSEMKLEDWQKVWHAKYRSYKVRSLDRLLFNVQFGKIYSNFAFRFGLFDSTGGAAVDVDIPFGLGDLRWISTFEVFDFNGVNRVIDEFRPHLKWLNRMFFTRNIYFTFGADDFISRHNKNAFFGVGIRFADDDVKYLMSRVVIAT